MQLIQALVAQLNQLKLVIFAQAVEIAALKTELAEAARTIDMLKGVGEQRYG